MAPLPLALTFPASGCDGRPSGAGPGSSNPGSSEMMAWAVPVAIVVAFLESDFDAEIPLGESCARTHTKPYDEFLSGRVWSAISMVVLGEYDWRLN